MTALVEGTTQTSAARAGPPSGRVRRRLHAAEGAVVGIGLLIGLAAIAAAFALHKPILILPAVLALVAVPLALVEPAVAAALLVFVELSGANDVIGSRGPVSLYLAALGIAAASTLIGFRRQQIRLVWSPVFLFFLVWVAAVGLTITVAPDPTLARDLFIEYVKDFVFFYLITMIFVARNHLTWMARIAVLCIAGLCFLSIVQQFALGNATTFFGFSKLGPTTDVGNATIRHIGPQDDPNFWGRSIVLFIPMALALWADRSHRLSRWIWTGAFLSMLGGIYLTGSRGDFIAAALAVVLWLALSGRRYARLLILVPFVTVAVLAVPGVGSRLLTLGPTSVATTGNTDVDPSIVGREVAQASGLHMVRDHPLLGVGAGNFGVVEPFYLRKLGLTTSLVLAPHNLYLQQAAEGGLVGLFAWLLFYGSVVVVATRTMILARTRVPGGVESVGCRYATGAFVALVAWAFASAFLHFAHERGLLVIVAFSVALDHDVRREIASLPPLERRRRRLGIDRRTIIRAAAAAAAALVVCLALGTWIGATRRVGWTSQAAVNVGPDVDHSAYSYDLLSRGTTVLTYAAIIAQPRFVNEAAGRLGLTATERQGLKIRLGSSSGSTLITVTAVGSSRRAVAGMPAAVAAAAGAYILSLKQPFVATLVTDANRLPVRAATDAGVYVVGGEVVGVVAAVAAFGYVVRRERRRQSHVVQADG